MRSGAQHSIHDTLNASVLAMKPSLITMHMAVVRGPWRSKGLALKVYTTYVCECLGVKNYVHKYSYLKSECSQVTH